LNISFMQGREDTKKGKHTAMRLNVNTFTFLMVAQRAKWCCAAADLPRTATFFGPTYNELLL